MPSVPGLQTFSDLAIKFIVLSVCLVLLPKSPFALYYDLIGDIPFLSYVNWFIPLDNIIIGLEFWIAAVTVYYVYMIAIRYANGLKGS